MLAFLKQARLHILSRDGMLKDSRYVGDVESGCNSVTIVSPQFCNLSQGTRRNI